MHSCLQLFRTEHWARVLGNGSNLPLMGVGEEARRFAHRVIYSRRFRKVSAFLAIGTLNRELYRAYGAPDERIVMLPHAVGNHFLQTKAL